MHQKKQNQFLFLSVQLQGIPAPRAPASALQTHSHLHPARRARPSAPGQRRSEGCPASSIRSSRSRSEEDPVSQTHSRHGIDLRKCPKQNKCGYRSVSLSIDRFIRILQETDKALVQHQPDPAVFADLNDLHQQFFPDHLSGRIGRRTEKTPYHTAHPVLSGNAHLYKSNSQVSSHNM